MFDNKMLERRTTIKLEPRAFDQVDLLSKRLGINISNVLRLAIAYFLREWDMNQEECLEH